MTVRLGFLDDDLAIARGRAAAVRLDAIPGAPRYEEVLLAPRGNAPVAALFRALSECDIDAAAIALDRLPTALPPGTALAAVLPRDEPWYAFASPSAPDLVDLPEGARVAAASAIARAQVRATRPDLDVLPIPGSPRAALDALDAGDPAALVLPAASLRLLGAPERIRATATATELTPAAGQGGTALLVRAGDAGTAAILAGADDPAARAECAAERAFVAALAAPEGTPVGALARRRGARLVLVGVVASVDGTRLLRLGSEGDPVAPEELGERLALLLVRAGGREILAGDEGDGSAPRPRGARR